MKKNFDREKQFRKAEFFLKELNQNKKSENLILG